VFERVTRFCFRYVRNRNRHDRSDRSQYNARTRERPRDFPPSTCLGPFSAHVRTRSVPTSIAYESFRRVFLTVHRSRVQSNTPDSVRTTPFASRFFFLSFDCVCFIVIIVRFCIVRARASSRENTAMRIVFANGDHLCRSLLPSGSRERFPRRKRVRRR